MARGIFIFIAIIGMTIDADAASVRGVSTASRTGIATATNQTDNPGASYTYNYMYPYLNNQMRTTLRPADPSSPSTSPINAIVRTEQLSAPRRVVPRKTAKATTNVSTTNNATTNSARATTNVATGAANGRRVVARSGVKNASNVNTAARVATRTTATNATTPPSGPVVTSARCLADYTECMNQYCERADTAYNRCYCSARLAQIDAEYQPQIDALVKQIVELQYNNAQFDASELNEYWATTIGKYTGDNSWKNIDNALNIDWSTMESRVRGQNAFLTGHEYCAQHIAGCFYMASNLRDAYRSSVAKDCDSYRAGLEKLKNAAEDIVATYSE